MVAKVVQLTESKKQIQYIHQVFDEQKAAFRLSPMPSYRARVDNLKKLKKAILKNEQAFIDTLNQDFSCRSEDETKLAELMTTVHTIDYKIKNLKQWMAPKKKKVSPLFQPASCEVQYQPLGVVGIISPWNYTLSLSLGPLVAALAAGNRVMIKMSEYTPATSLFLEELLSGLFPRDLVAVVNGDAEVATAFSGMPWNHLLFTGSTGVGRHVMQAAAKNLTPVTLELGGKSPTIIAHDVDMDAAAEAITFGKCFNAGQTCIAPDYVLCPESRVEHFVERIQHFFSTFYPRVYNNPDYSAIINERQLARLQHYLDDAESKGASIIKCNHPKERVPKGSRKLPLHIILNATDDMLVMQEEIFGPILPVKAINTVTEAVEYINDQASPLALYYFGHDKTEQQFVMDHVRSGGVCINDTLSHFAQEDMAFGGVGESGMGAYHGKQGFLTFSHAKSVFSKNRFNSTKFAYPPYGTAIHKMIFSIFLR